MTGAYETTSVAEQNPFKGKDLVRVMGRKLANLLDRPWGVLDRSTRIVEAFGNTGSSDPISNACSMVLKSLLTHTAIPLLLIGIESKHVHR